MFSKLLADLARSLDKRKISYMIVGGQSVLLYGEPRLTRGIDVTLGLDESRLSELMAVVSDLNWKPRVPDPESFVRETMVLPCVDGVTGIRVDFIFSDSTYEQEALQRVRLVTVGGTKVRYASFEDVLVHKLVAGRPRDLEDVRNLLVKNPRFDEAYLLKWLKEFEAALDKPLIKLFQSLCGEL